MAKIGGIGQHLGNKIEINPKNEETNPLATLAELSAFTGIPEANLSQYGLAGSAIKFDSEPGKAYQLFIDGKSAYSLVYFDNNGHNKLFPADCQAVIQPSGNNWGLALFKEFESSISRYAEVEIQALNPQGTPQFCLKVGSAFANPVTQTYTVKTKGSINQLQTLLGKDLSATTALEGSAVLFSIKNGVYSFELDATTAQESDELFAWNGYEFKSLWRFGQPVQLTADAVYGWLAFIGLDSVKSDEDSQFVIKNLVKTGEITYTVPPLISLIPDSKQGSVRVYDKYVSITTGAGSLPCDATFPLTLPSSLTNATEGSLAEWLLEDGNYTISYLIRTTESEPTNDLMFWYDGDETLTQLDTRASATIANTDNTRWVSNEKTANLTVTGGKLGLLVVDTGTTTGTTELRLTNIKKN